MEILMNKYLPLEKARKKWSSFEEKFSLPLQSESTAIVSALPQRNIGWGFNWSNWYYTQPYSSKPMLKHDNR